MKNRQKSKLAELMANQEGKRRDFYTVHDKAEIKAMILLARRLYGDLGLLEAGPQEPGVVYIGYYETGDTEKPAQLRARKLVLRGNTYRELYEQAVLLGISGKGLH